MVRGNIFHIGHAEYEVEMNLTGERALWVGRLANSGFYGFSRSHSVESMWPDWIHKVLGKMTPSSLDELREECDSLGYLRSCWSNRRASAFRRRQISLDSDGTRDNYPILLSMGGFMAYVLEHLERFYPSINNRFEGIELLIDDWFRVQDSRNDRIVPGLSKYIEKVRKIPRPVDEWVA